MEKYSYEKVCEAVCRYKNDRKVREFLYAVEISFWFLAMVFLLGITVLCNPKVSHELGFPSFRAVFFALIAITLIAGLYPAYSGYIRGLHDLNKKFENFFLKTTGCVLFNSDEQGERGRNLYGDFYIVSRYNAYYTRKSEYPDSFITINADIADAKYDYFLEITLKEADDGIIFGNALDEGKCTIPITSKLYSKFDYASAHNMLLIIHKDDYETKVANYAFVYPKRDPA